MSGWGWNDFVAIDTSWSSTCRIAYTTSDTNDERYVKLQVLAQVAEYGELLAMRYGILQLLAEARPRS